ncbi:MAG: phosphatidate cytidylyltransferase [Dehalococcoidales bacterium]|nr:phosphatidate cytidylyltransferase [Dehalococcoidales bacterium]
MMKQRFLTAIVGIPILVAAVWYDNSIPTFTIFVAAWGAVAALEFYRLVKLDKVPQLAYFGMAWTLLFILSRNSELLAMIKPYFDPGLLAPALLTSAITLSLIGLLIRRPREQAFNSWAWTMAGVLYTGWLLSYLVALRGSTDGRNWVLLALFATFASDTAAFFVGRTWGRRKLEPTISPAKTWEGSIAGICGAIIITCLFTLPTPLQINIPWWQGVILGLLVSVFGQFGDLIESLLKRNMGVKDSSHLLPGHGGLLDRMDSVVFAGVLVYYYMLWVTR